MLDTVPAGAKNSGLTTDFIKPVVEAAHAVFVKMLQVSPRRTELTAIHVMTPGHEVTAIVNVAGKAEGTVALSFSRSAALAVLARLVGEESTIIGPQVCDAVGELANMVAGNAKSKLADLELTLSIPTVIFGRNRIVRYPRGVVPMRLAFDSSLGPFSVDFGLSDG